PIETKLASAATTAATANDAISSSIGKVLDSAAAILAGCRTCIQSDVAGRLSQAVQMAGVAGAAGSQISLPQGTTSSGLPSPGTNLFICKQDGALYANKGTSPWGQQWMQTVYPDRLCSLPKAPPPTPAAKSGCLADYDCAGNFIKWVFLN